MKGKITFLLMICGFFGSTWAVECEEGKLQGRAALACHEGNSAIVSTLEGGPKGRFELLLRVENLGPGSLSFDPTRDVRYLAKRGEHSCRVFRQPTLIQASIPEPDPEISLGSNTAASFTIPFQLEDPTCELRYVKVQAGTSVFYLDPQALLGARIQPLEP